MADSAIGLGAGGGGGSTISGSGIIWVADYAALPDASTIDLNAVYGTLDTNRMFRRSIDAADVAIWTLVTSTIPGPHTHEATVATTATASGSPPATVTTPPVTILDAEAIGTTTTFARAVTLTEDLVIGDEISIVLAGSPGTYERFLTDDLLRKATQVLAPRRTQGDPITVEVHTTGSNAFGHDTVYLWRHSDTDKIWFSMGRALGQTVSMYRYRPEVTVDLSSGAAIAVASAVDVAINEGIGMSTGTLSSRATRPDADEVGDGDLYNFNGDVYERSVRHLAGTARTVRLLSMNRRTVENANGHSVPNINYSAKFRGFHLVAHGVGAAAEGDFYFSTTYGDFEERQTMPLADWVGYNPFEVGEPWDVAYPPGASVDLVFQSGTDIGKGIRVSMKGKFNSTVGVNGNDWRARVQESNAGGVIISVTGGTTRVVHIEHRIATLLSPSLIDVKAALEAYVGAVDVQFGVEYIGGASGSESLNSAGWYPDQSNIAFDGGGPTGIVPLDHLYGFTWSDAEARIAVMAVGEVIATQQSEILAVMEYTAGAAVHSEFRDILYNPLSHQNIGARGYFWFAGQTDRMPSAEATFPLTLTPTGALESAIFKFASDGPPNQDYGGGDTWFATTVVDFGAITNCGLRPPAGRYDAYVVGEGNTLDDRFQIFLREESSGADPRYFGEVAHAVNRTVVTTGPNTSINKITSDIDLDGATAIYLEGILLGSTASNWRGFVMLEYKGV